MKRSILFLLVLSFSITFISCRKNGCTDSLACNYDSEAHKDNGSCKYDRSTELYTQSVNLDEFATSNPVAEFTFTQYEVENCTDPTTTEVNLLVKNLLTDTISIECEVVMQEDAFTQYWSYNYTVNKLAPGMTDTVGVISTDPTSIEGQEFDFPGIYTVTIY